MAEKLFTPLAAGEIRMRNRVVMAPLTRNRAEPGEVPGDLAVEYYRQRAGAGMIVTEASQISPTGRGYADTPGIHSPEQVAGWRRVTDAVHARGGTIAIQLRHVGRVSHTLLQPGGAQPVAPSALTAKGRTYVNGEYLPCSEPRALRTEEIPGIVADFGRAAANARAAGFDAVEIHGANGYLIDQFLRDSTNLRDDAYGGPVENRIRFLREVVAAVVAEMGAGRTGIRISPWSAGNGAALDSDPAALFAAVIDVLNAAGLAYVHAIEGQTQGAREWPAGAMEALRARFRGAWIVNNGYDREMAVAAVASGAADAVAFGRCYISNPDLAERLEHGWPLAPRPTERLYGGGAQGYIDYPAHAG